jgi:hypothetical protein
MRNGSEPATAAAAPPPQETALAGAATPTQATRAMPALTSIFVIRTGGCKFSKPGIDCFGLAIDITTLLSASGSLYLAFIYLVANARLSRTDTPTLLVIVVVLQYRLLLPAWRKPIRQVRCAPSRAEAVAVRQVGMRTGLTVPRQTARQPGAELSATGDAELGQDVVVDRGGRGRSGVRTGGLNLHRGKSSRQR